MNVCSLVPHFDDILFFFDEYDIDIFGISETWLKPQINNNLIKINGYNIYRNDRPIQRGGGVCIYFKETLKINELTVQQFGRIEYLAAELLNCFGKLFILVIYVPPPTTLNDVNDLQNLFCHHLTNYSQVIMLGDLNIDMLVLPNKFFEVLTSLNLYNLPFKATHSSSLLDLIIINDSDRNRIVKFEQKHTHWISNHDMVFMDYTIFYRREKKCDIYFRDFSNVNFDLFPTIFNNLYWENRDLSNINYQVDNFINNYRLLFDSCIPVKKIVQFSSMLPWFNSKINKSIRIRDQRHRTWLRSGTIISFIKYKKARNSVTYLVRKAKKSYYFSNVRLNSKKLWTNIKQLGIIEPPKTFHNKFPIDDINKHFIASNNKTIHLPLPDKTFYFRYNHSKQFNFREISQMDVFNAIFKIKSNAVGNDGVNIKFLKLFFPYFIPFMTKLYNNCVICSTYPASWKIASVIPIPKQTKVTTLNALRPVSILSVMSKVMENILYLQINNFLLSNKLLHPLQSGFRHQHSTRTALTKIVDDISFMLDKPNSFVVLVLLDFTRAFDMIDHKLLLQKLFLYYNFSHLSLELLHSYLSDRYQFVSTDGTKSSSLLIIKGVPQGSSLSPLLFSIFINDLPTKVKSCNFHLYADDCQIYRDGSFNEIQNVFNAVNCDLAEISSWADANGLVLNALKTKAIFLTKSKHALPIPKLFINNEDIEFVSNGKNLGLNINSIWNWDSHIINLCKKIIFILYKLKFIKKICPLNMKLYLIKSLVVPHLLYCDIIYYQCDYQSKLTLKITYNNCLRYIHNLMKYDHISMYETTIFGCSLANFYKLRMACFIYDLIRVQKPEYLYDKIKFTQSLRTWQIILPKPRTNTYHGSVLFQCSLLWNSLPLNIRRLKTMGLFKEAMLKYLN